MHTWLQRDKQQHVESSSAETHVYCVGVIWLQNPKVVSCLFTYISRPEQTNLQINQLKTHESTFGLLGSRDPGSHLARDRKTYSQTLSETPVNSFQSFS